MGSVHWPGGRPGFGGEMADAVPTVDVAHIAAIAPATFREARAIGEYFRGGIPVVVNLTGMEHADAKRVVDFASGLVFSLRGRLDRIAQRVFVLLPAGVSLLTAPPAVRQDDGFFNQG